VKKFNVLTIIEVDCQLNCCAPPILGCKYFTNLHPKHIHILSGFSSSLFSKQSVGLHNYFSLAFFLTYYLHKYKNFSYCSLEG